MSLRLLLIGLYSMAIAGCATGTSTSDDVSAVVPPGSRPVSECKIPCSVSPGPNCC